MTSDKELLAAWCAGDNRAGSELLRGHFRRLYSFFRNKAGDHTEDLIQQTMMACAQSRDRLRDHASFRSFLLRIARNKLYDFLREKSRSRVDLGVSSVFDLRPSPSSVVARGREHALVLESLQRLPVAQQVVIELRYWDELSINEIADILEIPAGTVKSRLRLAREGLARRLRNKLSDTAGLSATLQRSRPVALT